MKFAPVLVAVSTLLASVAFAQKAPPPTVAAAPAATVKAVCKDGTPFEGSTLRGACRGHGGVDKQAAAPATGSAAPVVPAAAAKTAPKTAAAAPAPAPAPGGKAGQVWVNSSTKVYHCQGTKFYGKTKTGEYMAEADAKAKGFHAARGKACDV